MKTRCGHRYSRILGLTLGAALISGLGVSAEKHQRVCGSFDGAFDLVVEIHEWHQRRAASVLGPRGSRVDRAGNLALIEGDKSLILPPNSLDLQDLTLHFSTNGGASYGVSRKSSVLDLTLGREFNFGDDDTRSIELLFPFTYYGKVRERIFVNSNGNLTFREADLSGFSSNSDMLDEPPRIAPFFTDLDPSAGGSVRIASQPDRLVVTWEAVPEWRKSNENTFQVELRDDGDIIMRYGVRLGAASVVVGLGSGSRDGARFVDVSQTTRTSSGALFERFFPEPVVDTVATVRRFYQVFSDSYDAVVLWTNFRSDLDDAFAFHVIVKNDVRGIGRSIMNRTSVWGSRGKLQSFVLMGNLSQYPSGPREAFFRGGANTLELLAHEVGHRWLAFPRIRERGDPTPTLLGRGKSHWSFFFDSGASFLEGNDFEEEGPGRFRSVDIESRYSKLDLYLMGLASPGEVGPVFVVPDGRGEDDFGRPFTNESSPLEGALVRGTRKNVLVDDIIAAEGPRMPDVDGSPKSFRHAFILLSRPSRPPSGEELQKLDDIRRAWEGFFQTQTLGRATALATLE